MASGTPPFASQDEDELVVQIRTATPRPVPEVTADLNDLLLNLLKKLPGDRPSWERVVRHRFWQGGLGDCFENQFTGFSEKQLPKAPAEVAAPAVDLRKSLRVSADRPARPEKPPSPAELLVDSPLLNPVPLALNPSIEKDVLPPCDGIAMPVSVGSLRSNDRETVNDSVRKLMAVLGQADRPASKAPVLSYLVRHGQTREAAENLANSALLARLLTFAGDAIQPELVSLFLLLFGVLVANAQTLTRVTLTGDDLHRLKKFCDNAHPPIARKAVAAVGELVSRRDTSFPQFAGPVMLGGLRSGDEIVRHLSVRALANVLRVRNSSGHLEPAEVAGALSRFEPGSSPAVLESFGTCWACLGRAACPKSAEFMTGLARTLMGTESGNARILGLIIAAEAGNLAGIKDGIVGAFRSATGELRLKVLLAMSVVFKDTWIEFADHAARFFGALEKLQTEDPEPADALMQWGCALAENIVDSVAAGGPFDALQILHHALQIRSLAVRMWTARFEKKIQKIVRNTLFNTVRSEVALQIIQCALGYQLADVAIVTDLCRALNSQLPIVRFTVLKLIADLAQHPIPAPVLGFIESNVMTQLLSLLQDERVIVDQTLRILAAASAERPALTGPLVRPHILALIVANVCDNSWALDVVTRVIERNAAPAEVLVNARLIPAILSSMEKKENQGTAIALLAATLGLIERQLGEAKNATARRTLVKSVHSLATMAAKTGALLLEFPLAGQCLCMMIRMFTPQGTQNEVLIDSAFHPFSIALSQGCRKPEHSSTLCQVIRALQAAADSSSAMRLRLKGAGTLVTALKKACEYGSDDLKQAALACQKTIRG
jgi:hypothetical protein